MTEIRGCVALVTGGNRGVGLAVVQELLARGAAKVYAGARTPGEAEVPGAEVVQLDITDPAQVAAAAAHCSDVTLLVNNAGYHANTRLVVTPEPDAACGRGPIHALRRVSISTVRVLRWVAAKSTLAAAIFMTISTSGQECALSTANNQAT